jgi:hypothetical protein
MTEPFNNKDNRQASKKKTHKSYHDDDKYGENKIKKEFKRKKQHLQEEESWQEWSDKDN